MKSFRKHKKLWSFLAIWLLFTTSGFSINEHYCNGILKNTAIVIEPGCCDTEAACHSIADEINVSIESKNDKAKCCKNSTTENQCCSTEYNFVQLDVELLNSTIQTQKILLPEFELFTNNSIKFKAINEASFQAFNFNPYNFIFVLNKAPLALFQNFLL